MDGVSCNSSSFLSSCLHTKGHLESLNVSFMVIDIGHSKLIQSLDTERADLPLPYSVTDVGYADVMFDNLVTSSTPKMVDLW